MQVGIGRWYARLEANRPKEEKVYDEHNNTYKEATYTYEQLVADDLRAIAQFNNQKHPNQKMYPGLTRWEVLCQNQNPDLAPVDKALLYRFIGEKTRTSIRRSMYCTVRGEKFRLPSPDLLERLAPNDYEVQAYYLPDDAGEVSEVYVYQDDHFIAKCAPVGAYNEATTEQTDKDRQNYVEQAKYVSEFDALMKREKIRKVHILPHDLPADEVETVKTVAPAAVLEPLDDFSFDTDYAALAKQEL